MNPKKNVILAMSAVVLCLSVGAHADVIAPSNIVHEDWSNLDDWSVQTGIGGTTPSVSGGVLSISMVGATGGGPAGARNTTSVPLDYTVNVRTKVTQFPDIPSFDTNDSNNQGVQLVDIRGEDILTVAVMPTAIFVNDQVSPGGHNWTEISVTTDVNTFYSWQFQVSELAGNANGGGTVDIYRRLLDTDPFALVGSSELRGTLGSSSIYAGRIWNNTEGSQIQGSMEVESFSVGTVIPEPSSGILLLLSLSALGGIHHLRKKR